MKCSNITLIITLCTFLLLPENTSQLNTGEPAPRIILFNFEDVVNGTDDYIKNSVKLYNKFGKKALVLSFFTKDCENCKIEIPKLQELAKEFDNNSVEFYLIHIKTQNDNMDGLKKDISSRGYTLPILSHRYPETVLKSYIKSPKGAILPVPMLYIINQKGDISYFKKGFDTKTPDKEIAKIKAQINKALK